MADNKQFTASVARPSAQVDAGLRAYMLGVYNHMTTAMLVTGFAAYGTKWLALTNPGFANLIYASPLKWVIVLAPLGMVFWLSARLEAMSAGKARNLFYIFAGLMGLSLSSLLLVYTGSSVARAFFITAGAFSALSLYGYTTSKNLSGLGSFLIMGLIGLILASIVNLFLASTAFDFLISVVGVLIFAGLTAYDTQQIKMMYMESDSQAMTMKKSIHGALRLYLDFINMFILILQLFGNRE